MLIKKIILRNSEPFETSIANWCNKNKVTVEVFDGKESLYEVVSAMVIMHADHNISRENKDLRAAMEKHHKPTQEIDINGTMNASLSSLRFWIENNNPESILMVGDPKLIENSRFEDYFKNLESHLN
jgi:hypothetical protein